MHPVFFALIGSVFAQSAGSNVSTSLDLFPPKSFAVLGENATFRTFATNQTFNPHGRTPPFIQVFDKSFSSILGSNPIFRQVASNSTFSFAFEAAIYAPQTDEIFFSSALLDANLTQSNRISKVKMADVEKELESNSSTINVPSDTLDLSGTLNMTNGGTGPFQGSLLFATEGFGQNPPVLALVDPKLPYSSTVILDNYFGRQFNSLDDVKIHPSGKIFFTDPVSDTSEFAIGGENQTRPSLIYAFDVDPDSLMLKSKRAFAFPDAGIPDGITVDSEGNVYSGCGDGVQVWSPKGKLLGKFFIGSSVASMVFAGDGRLMIMGGHTLFIAKIAAKGGIFTS
ncbi:hypothetical protein BDQ17DRAFT_1416059 [Cyathus striatus]|nr:hypothetical protein BDQ17DRAFT_1416059 [Cyathus striatus]